MAVSWSSGWFMVTIWPIFMSILMTSEAFTDILCANSDTVMVSGTCTSRMRTSTGAACAWWSPPRSRSPPRRPPPPRAPPRQALPRPAPAVSPRVGMPFFLAGSPAQLEDSLADLTSLPAPAAGAAAAVPAVRAPGAPTGLCKVPFFASPVTARGAGLGSSGFLATSTLAGVDIMERIAAASASALRRRSPRSVARAASSWARARDSASAFSRASVWAAARAATSAAYSRDASFLTAEACAFLSASWVA